MDKENCYLAALKACGARIMLLDSDGVVQLANPALLDFFNELNRKHPDAGLPADETALLGRPLADCLPLGDAAAQIRQCGANTRIRVADPLLALGVVASPVDCEQGGVVLTWQLLSGQKQLSDDLNHARESIAAGRLETRLPANSALAARINACLEAAQTSLNVLADTADDMAQCDLSSELPTHYDGVVGEIFGKLAGGLSNLSEAIRQTISAANAIAVTTEEISKQNRELAARTDEQSKAVELTGQNMEELSGTVKNNASHAREAEQYAQEANRLAESGRESVLKVVESMNAINASSEQVTGIIAMINEIAFQTNILSLNAAVEAARAGEHGRGFGVVATEVRNLAQRSASAANEIKKLIEHSGTINAQGQALADEAEQKMGEVLQGVQEVTQRIAEISAATGEQAQGIQHANDAISQIEGITQQNHSLVRKLADNTGELNDQAAFLRAAAQVFKLPQGEFTHAEHAKVCQIAQQTAKLVGRTFEQALAKGQLREDDLYDQDYQPIEGTNPPKFRTRFDTFTDRALAPLQEQVLDVHPELIYAISADFNGYVPTHNERFAKPLTGDYDTDFAGNRTKRIFEDPVGKQVGRHTEPYKLQTYRRDTGELMFDLSAPIYVNGRHWGGFRIGYRIE